MRGTRLQAFCFSVRTEIIKTTCTNMYHFTSLARPFSLNLKKELCTSWGPFHLCTDTNLTGWWWLIWTTEHRSCHSLGVAWYLHWTFKLQYGFLQELAILFPSIELFEKEMSLWFNSSQLHLHSVLIPLPYALQQLKDFPKRSYP